MTYSSTIEELEDLRCELRYLTPLKIKNNNKIVWTGGLIGAIHDSIKEKKTNNYLEQPIMNTNFLNIPGILIDRAKSMAQVFLESGASDVVENAENVLNLIEDCYSIWLSKCPGIENCLIDDPIGNGVSLPLGVVTNYYLYQTFKEYPLCETTCKKVNDNLEFQEWRIRRLKEKDKNTPTGCLGTIITIVTFIGMACWLLVLHQKNILCY